MSGDVDNSTWQAGDLAVLVGPSGHWVGPYEFVRFDEHAPKRLMMRSPDGGSLYSVRADLVKRPNVLGASGDAPKVSHVNGQPSTGHEPNEAVTESACQQSVTGRRFSRTGGDPGRAAGITGAQRRTIFGLAKGIGFGLDDVRALTPCGSVSALSRAEAADLINRLRGGSGQAAESGTYDDSSASDRPTAAQRRTLAKLRAELGFTDAQFAAWIAGRFRIHDARKMDRKPASRVIGALIAMRKNRRRRPYHGEADARTMSDAHGPEAAVRELGGAGGIVGDEVGTGSSGPDQELRPGGQPPTGGCSSGSEAGFKRASQAV